MRETRGAIGLLERVLHLKKIPAAKNLPNEALAALAEAARERYFPTGSVVFPEDAVARSIHVVLDGQIRMTRGDLEVSSAGPGTPVGSLGVLARMPLGLRGVAAEDSLTLELESDAFLETCEDHFVIVHSLLRYMARWAVEIERSEGPHGPPPGGCQPPRRLLGGDLDLVERIFYLRQFAIFSEASINALAELARGLTEVSFGADIPLWHAGDASPYALLVVEGEIDCHPPSGGPRFRACPGWGVGHLEALGELPRWYDAVTATPVIALHGPMEGLVDVFEDNTEMAMSFLSLLARGILTYMERKGRDAVPAPAA
jgi:CRP-like cAMP-binding protein